MIRQPIVCVLGHIDHGKTALLDAIRGSAMVQKEPGRITQHIGATEIPLDTIYQVCGPLLSEKTLAVPGLLFIDTPGHRAFVTLRARGGALADLAILIVDVNEGFMPQTLESLRILKQYKTPFIIAANKIDLLPGWQPHHGAPIASTLPNQSPSTKAALDRGVYQLVESAYDHGFHADRYEQITDFTETVAIVPISAKTSEGIPELLMVLLGLAQRYLAPRLQREKEWEGEGTVLEVKEVEGLGPTIDIILYNGSLRRGDQIVVGGVERPIITKVRALLRPKPLVDIRLGGELAPIERVSAAAGVRIAAPGLSDVVAGSPIRVVSGDVAAVVEQVQTEAQPVVELAEKGLVIKADSVGSLEALAYELRSRDIPIRMAGVGDVSKREVVDASVGEPPAILAFCVQVLPDAAAELSERGEVGLIQGDVMYQMLEDYEEWASQRKAEQERAMRRAIVYPGSVKILPGCVFRVSKPAIIGVRVLAGHIRPGCKLLREDGRVLGRVKSVQSEGKGLKEAIAGAEVAIAIENVTVGRQVHVEDVLYVDISEGDARRLREVKLNPDEQEVLQRVCEIKRQKKASWGM